MSYKTRPDLSSQYYVYSHIDPETSEVLYIGRGYGPRAYATNSSSPKRGYSDRHPNHSLRLHQLMNEGYLPHEWVKFVFRNITREDSKKYEARLIKEYSPKFNRKPGVDKRIFSEEELSKINKMREDKVSYDKIGQYLNCSRSTIHRLFVERK